MRKILIFYWYVPEFYWHPIYNLHLKNLLVFKDVFDEVRFVISTDNDLTLYNKTVESLGYILPDANFSHFINDKSTRESAFFFQKIINNLDKFDDNTALFFAHNKGVETYYKTKLECMNWINVMYYFNLRKKEKIDELLNDPKICAIGTGRRTNYAVGAFTDISAYKWHYAGTFFWIVPKRLKQYIIENNIIIPENPGRYHTEAFLGNIFSEDSEHCYTIGGDINNGSWEDYIDRALSDEEKKDYLEIESFYK